MTAIERVEHEIARLTEVVAEYTPSPDVLHDAAVAGNNKPVVADFHGAVCGWADWQAERDLLLRRLEYREAVKAARESAK
jgi:hypothetical protein